MFNPRSVQYKLASTLDERLEALHLVYESYVKAGLLNPSGSGLRITPFHALSDTKIFIASDSGKIIYTLSFIPDSSLGIPMEVIYPREVQTFRMLNRKFGELSCLAGNSFSLDIFMGLCRFVYGFGLYAKLDHFLIAVHPSRERFYERVWGFRQFGPIREYPCVLNHPAVALEGDFKKRDILLPPRTKRYIEAHPVEEQAYLGGEPSKEDLDYLRKLVDSEWRIVSMDTNLEQSPSCN